MVGRAVGRTFGPEEGKFGRLDMTKKMTFEFKDCDRNGEAHKFDGAISSGSNKVDGFICGFCHLSLTIDEKDILYPYRRNS